MTQTSIHQDKNWVNQDNTTTDSTNINGTYCEVPIYYKPHGETGWVCPRCGRGVAPWKSYCDCNDNWTITCGPSVVTTPATGNPVSNWQTTTVAGTTAGTVTSRNGVYEYHGPCPDVTL